MPYVRKVYDPGVCGSCGKTFPRKREWQKYCSDKCKSKGRSIAMSALELLADQNLKLKEELELLRKDYDAKCAEARELNHQLIASQSTFSAKLPAPFRYDDEDQSVTWKED